MSRGWHAKTAHMAKGECCESQDCGKPAAFLRGNGKIVCWSHVTHETEVLDAGL